MCVLHDDFSVYVIDCFTASKESEYEDDRGTHCTLEDGMGRGGDERGG